jgi:hypothetical protein
MTPQEMTASEFPGELQVHEEAGYRANALQSIAKPWLSFATQVAGGRRRVPYNRGGGVGLIWVDVQDGHRESCGGDLARWLTNKLKRYVAGRGLTFTWMESMEGPHSSALRIAARRYGSMKPL